MSLDIKLGCLTLHLEDNNWFKGMVDDKKSNVLQKLRGGEFEETPKGGRDDKRPSQAA